MNSIANAVNKMSNQTRPRNSSPLVLLCGLFLLIALAAGWYFRHTQRAVADAMVSNVASLRAGQELEMSMHELRCQIDRYLIDSEFKHLEPIPRYRQRAAAALSTAENEARTSEEQRLMQRTRAGFAAFFADFDRLLKGEPNRKAYLDILSLMDTVFASEVIGPTREYMRLNEGMLTRGSKENQELSSRIVWALIGVCCFGVVSGVVGGWLVGSGFRRTLRQNEARLRMTTQQLNQVIPRHEQMLSDKKAHDPVEEIGQTASAVIARLKQTERDVLRAEQLALVGQMAAGIAHEVRNPLMAIKLLLQVRTESGRDRLRSKDLEILQDEIVRMERIISSFLDFARPPQLEKRFTEIAPLLTHVLAGVQGRAALQGVSLEAYLPTYPVETKVDPDQFCQVLYNLLFNALDAQSTGGTIAVRMHVEHTDFDQPSIIVLQIEDEGTGLPAEVAKRVFEPFVSTKATGMGLGLSICRRIIEGHGGSIGAENRKERSGALFTVYLPVTLPENDSDRPRGQHREPQMVK